MHMDCLDIVLPNWIRKVETRKKMVYESQIGFTKWTVYIYVFKHYLL